MPINPAVVGREYVAPEPYEVSREHLRVFADAIGDASPLYRDVAAARAAGHPDVIAPPTYLTVLTFRFAAASPLADPDLGLDYRFVVHGEQSFTAHRAVHAGDRLRPVTRVESVRAAGRNELMALVTEVIDEAGAPVATLRNTIVSRGTAA